MKYAFCLFCAALVAFTSTARAADESPATNNREKRDMLKAQAERPFKLPAAISLSPEQQAKIDELKKEHQPKFIEALKKVNAALTPEQRKARMQAAKEARQAGKKPSEVKEAVESAVSLSDDEKKMYSEAEAEANKVRKEISDHVKSVLTQEQRAQLKKERKNATS